MVHYDVGIFGGGIAGLWLLVVLRKHGYNVLLLEARKLGAGQTIASQGMLHKGFKYIGGDDYDRKLVAETNASFQLWRNCFSPSDLDVRLAQDLILTDRVHYVLRDTSSVEVLDRVKAELQIELPGTQVARSAWPTILASSPYSTLFVASETVLDVPELLRALSALGSGSVCGVRNSDAITWHQNKFVLNDTVELSAKCFIFCAGLGNEEFARQLAVRINVQKRALRMVLVGPVKDSVYAHFCERGFLPELTITTHSGRLGKFWYLGGEVAECGGKQSSSEVIECAKALIRKHIPSVTWKDSRWSTYFVERAELAHENGLRPSTYGIHEHDHFLFAWPTKLCLVPKMCETLCSRVSEIVGAPTRMQAAPPPEGLDSNVQFAVPPWYHGGDGS